MSTADARAQMHTLLAYARGVDGPLVPDQMVDLVHRLNLICRDLDSELDAQTCLREAVRISRQLVKGNHPDARHYLIVSLQNLGEALNYLPKGAQGIKPAEELSAVWKELTELDGPIISQSNAANSLNSLALRYQEADDLETAVRVGVESLAAWRKVTTSLPGDIMAMQLFAIQNQYNRLIELGRDDGLESLAREGVEVAAKLESMTFGDPQAREQARQSGDLFHQILGGAPQVQVQAQEKSKPKGWRFWR